MDAGVEFHLQKAEGGYVGEGSGGIVSLSPLFVSNDSNMSA